MLPGSAMVLLLLNILDMNESCFCSAGVEAGVAGRDLLEGTDASVPDLWSSFEDPCDFRLSPGIGLAGGAMEKKRVSKSAGITEVRQMFHENQPSRRPDLERDIELIPELKPFWCRAAIAPAWSSSWLPLDFSMTSLDSISCCSLRFSVNSSRNLNNKISHSARSGL